MRPKTLPATLWTLTALALLAALTAPVSAQWPTSPYEDIQLNNYNSGTLMCSDGAGGALYLWGSGTGDLLFQHIDSSGYKLCGEWGRVALTNAQRSAYPNIMSDGAGGMMFSRTRDYQIGPGLLGHRLDGMGNSLWSDEGVLLSSIPFGPPDDFQQLVPDGNGGMIVVCQFNSNTAGHLLAQRISAEGQVLWEPNGVIVTLDTLGTVGQNRAAPDGTGGVIVFYPLHHPSTQPSFGHYAQRINGSGEVCWQNPGILISSMPGGGGIHEAISDGRGGAWIGWNQFYGTWREVIQHVDSTGQKLWRNGYLLNPSGTTAGGMHICTDGSDGILFTFNRYQAGPTYPGDHWINHMNYQGELLWGYPGSHVISNVGNLILHDLCPDGAGGAFALVEQRYHFSFFHLWMQRISSDGQILWTPRGKPLALSEYNQIDNSGVIIPDNRGGAIANWPSKARPFPYPWFPYTKRIGPDGELGAHLSPASALLPAQPQLALAVKNQIISYFLPKMSEIELSIYDLMGRKMAVLVKEYRQSGDYTFNYNPSDLPSGVYLLNLKSDYAEKAVKLVVLK